MNRLGILEARDHEADLAHAEGVERELGGTAYADAVDEELLAALHHEQVVTLLNLTVENADRGDDAAILIEIRVEDEGLERLIGVAGGRAHEEDDSLEQVVDALARLSGDAHGVVGGDGELVLDLDFDLIGMGRRQVDLVDGGNDVQVGVHREARIGDRLCLDALGGVDHEDGALACREAAGDLIGEVDVTGRVDEVELVGLAVIGVVHHADGIRLDGDATLALDVHGVEQLRLHVALLHRAGELEDAVGDRRLAVVDVRNDREVADVGSVKSIHADHLT